MQHTEFHHHVGGGHAHPVHPEGDERDQHTAPKDQHAAPEAPRAERGAAAGQNDKNRAPVLLNEGIERWKIDLFSEEIDQIEHEVDKDDTDNAEPAQGVKLPDAFAFLLHNLLLIQCAGRKGPHGFFAYSSFCSSAA